MTDYDALVKALRCCVDKVKGCDDCPYMEKCLTNRSGKHVAMLDAADAIEHLIEERDAAYLAGHQIADKLPIWISVEERLPERGSVVIAYSSELFTVIAYYNDDEEWDIPDPHITHWMPIPAPPKEET